MGKSAAPAPTPPPATPVPQVIESGRTEDPANRPVVRRDDADAAQASLLSEGQAAADVDPLTQRKQMSGGSANLIA